VIEYQCHFCLAPHHFDETDPPQLDNYSRILGARKCWEAMRRKTYAKKRDAYRRRILIIQWLYDKAKWKVPQIAETFMRSERDIHMSLKTVVKGRFDGEKFHEK